MSPKVEFHNIEKSFQGRRKQLAPGLSARIFPGDQAMLSLVTVEANAEGTLHSHPEEQWGVLLKGDGVRTQGGRRYPVVAGDFWRTPGGMSHTFKAGDSGALVLDIFSPPRRDYE